MLPVEVKVKDGSQNAKDGSNVNVVQIKEGAHGVRKVGDQVDGKDNKPDSANFEVEVKAEDGSQIAKNRSNVNLVQNNKGAPLPKCNYGVTIGGDQVAGKDNKKKGAQSRAEPYSANRGVEVTGSQTTNRRVEVTGNQTTKDGNNVNVVETKKKGGR